MGEAMPKIDPDEGQNRHADGKVDLYGRVLRKAGKSGGEVARSKEGMKRAQEELKNREKDKDSGIFLED